MFKRYKGAFESIIVIITQSDDNKTNMQFMQARSDFHKKNLEEYSFRKNQSYDRKHMHMQIADPIVGGPEEYDLLFSKILN